MDPTALPLRDVHLPPPVGWWPPAPGWWLLAAGVLALLSLTAWWWWRSAPRRRLRREALATLDALLADYRATGDAARLLQGLSTLLRRIAIARWGRERVARLHGEAWLAFLRERTGAPPVDPAQAALLLEAPYRAVPPAFDAESLVAGCRRWVCTATAPERRGRP